MTEVRVLPDPLHASLAALLCAALWLAAAPAWAQGTVQVSPDVTGDFGSGPSAVVSDEELAADAGSGATLLLTLGPIPPGVDVEAWSPYPTGDKSLLSLDTTAALPGLPAGMPAEPRDVVEYDPATGLYSTVFDGSATGVPASVRVDAVSLDAALDLLLSFDTTVSLPGVGTVDDEDLVLFSGGLYASVFDGSALGVATSTDLDGAHQIQGSDLLLVSFDTSGSVGGVSYDDEDVLAYDTGLGTFAMYFDASLSDPVAWPGADVDALPEPAATPALFAGVALLRALRRRRGAT